MNPNYNLNTVTTKLPSFRGTSSLFDSLDLDFSIPTLGKRTPPRTPPRSPPRRPSPDPRSRPLPNSYSRSAWESPAERRHVGSFEHERVFPADERMPRSKTPLGSERPAHIRAGSTPARGPSPQAFGPRYQPAQYPTTSHPPPVRGPSPQPLGQRRPSPQPLAPRQSPPRPMPPRLNYVSRDNLPAPALGSREPVPGLSERPLAAPAPLSAARPIMPGKNTPPRRQNSYHDAENNIIRLYLRESLLPKPLAPRGKPVKPIGNGADDYLSMEQLESLWEAQDQYTGTIEAPAGAKPASPMWRLASDDPRSPIHAVHPAFRNHPLEYRNHNSFATGF